MTKKENKLGLKGVRNSEIIRRDVWNEGFFCNSTHVDFDGTLVTIDFLFTSSRANLNGPTPIKITDHRPVTLDLKHAKNFSLVFSNFIASIEKAFGEIGTKEFEEKFREANKKAIQSTKQTTKSSENLSYVG